MRKGLPFSAPIRSNFLGFFRYCRREYFEDLLLFLSLRYGADLGRSRLVNSFLILLLVNTKFAFVSVPVDQLRTRRRRRRPRLGRRRNDCCFLPVPGTVLQTTTGGRTGHRGQTATLVGRAPSVGQYQQQPVPPYSRRQRRSGIRLIRTACDEEETHA